MYHILFSHPSVDGHSGGFCILAIINAVVMNNGCMYLLGSCFFLWIYAQECISGSYGSSIFSFLKNIHIFLHSACTTHFSANSVGGFPSFCTLSSISCLWIFFFTHVKKSILTGVVLICISLTTISVEHLFMPSLEKSLFRSSSHVLSGLFVLMLLSVICFLQILEPNPLSVT